MKNSLKQTDPEIWAAIKGEEKREREGLELIPSENYTYPEVLEALGSVLTNKYAEGYPGKRYYGGQEFTDKVETLAIERAKELFGADHANVQALSGSPMNQAVYLAICQPGDTIMGMDLSHGGHLTHGAPVSHMGKLFNFIRYKTNPDAGGAIDFDEVRKLALKHRPKIILCGYTSYPRTYDYAQFRKIADDVGAIAMADVSHIGGLIAGKAMRNPFDDGFDVVTTTTHKTLRGPRGALILSRGKVSNPMKQVEFTKENLPTILDKSVFPGLQGGPHMNTIAGIAVALKKASTDDFRIYAKQVLVNAKAMAQVFADRGVDMVTGGTDNHMIVVNTINTYGMDGKEAETLLDKVGITVNRQVVPDDPNPPFRPSGIRLGTPAMTARGLGADDVRLVAGWIDDVLRAGTGADIEGVRGQVLELSRSYEAGLKSRG